MIPSDDILMAYVDGSLDPVDRGQVELAMLADPAVAAKVRQFIAARRLGTYAGSADLPRPPRLRDAGKEQAQGGAPAPAPASSRAKVVQLDSRRLARRQAAPGSAFPFAASAASAPSAAAGAALPRWSPPRGLALAAMLMLGIAGGVLAVTGYHSEIQFAAVNGNGLLRAHGKLDAALSGQPGGGAQPRGSLRIGVSFVSRDGQYCRAFELGAASGLACRAGAGWNIPVLVEGEGAAGNYRPVGSPLPAAVLAAIDARAVGPALDGTAEQAALARGWSR
jgi:hypothetical protein